MNKSPGSITLAEIEIALSRAQASLYLSARGERYVATVVRNDTEYTFPCESLTDAIDAAAQLAGISLTDTAAMVAA